MLQVKCAKLNFCSKIMMVLDKDMLDFQYAESILAVCAKCKASVNV